MAPSALAAQLAASTSLNASLLQDRSKKRHVESYLFTGKDADLHDLDAIHALACTAFTHLRSLSPAFSYRSIKLGADESSLAVDFEQVLFSDAARALDRTLQTPEINANLDRNINAFLTLLGPWLTEVPSSKVLEWFVRRFRVNEFNVDAILALFLPHHESPHFVKMLSILHIQPNSSFSFLLPFKSATKPLSRSGLIKEMISDTDVARFVANLLPTAVKYSHLHRTLLSFHVATMHDYISSAPMLDDGILALILPSLLAPLQSSQKDSNSALGSFVLLCALAQKVNLKPAAVSAIINAMASQVRGVRGSGKGSVSTAHFVKAVVAICSAQPDVQEFPLSMCQSCTKMMGFNDELSKIMAAVGVEHFILPLLRPLSGRIHEHRVSSLFSTVINAANVPTIVIRELSRVLVRLATLLSDSDDEAVEVEKRDETVRVARSLLSLIHQRHLELLRDVTNNILSEDTGESDPDQKERKRTTSELLTSFTLDYPLAESSNVNEVVVASASTSKEIRVAAVAKMYLMLKDAEIDLSAPDKASIQSALLGRVYDTHTGVLHVLYGSPTLFLSTVVSSMSPQQLLEVINSQLSPVSPARTILRAHVAFLAGPFIKAHPDLASAVQQTSLFPFLLASRSKFKTTRGVWEAVMEGDGFRTGWLRGCVEIWKRTSLMGNDVLDAGKDDSDGGSERLCDTNLDVADKIAENILLASDSAQDIAIILTKFRDPSPYARALACLVCRALLTRTSGDQQVLLAHRIIRAVRLTAAEADDDLTLKEALDARHVGMKVVLKPGGREAVHALQVSILALISALPIPYEFSSAWISVIPSGEEIPSDRSQCYVSLVQELYTLASATARTVPNQFSTSVLQALFLNLKDNSLAFLLGIILSSSPSLESARTHALLHVLAFIRGHSGAETIDFQTVLPTLIAVLLDARSDKRDRALIFESISLLGGTSEKKHMYGSDTLYGSASSHLQYVDTNDLSTYVKALVDNREQLIQDVDYIRVFHQKHFQGLSAKYRRRVLCFLLSHVISHPFPFARVALLRSIEDVSDFSKPHMLLPVMKGLIQDPAPIAQMFGASFETYLSLVVAGFLSITPTDLALRDDNEAWPLFISGLRSYFHSNSDASARELYAIALEQRLFVGIDLEKRIEVCTVLLQAGSEGGEAYLASRTLLGKLVRDVEMIARLLAQFRPDHVEGEAPVSKRAKLDQTPRGSETGKLQPLSLLAEVLGTTEVPGSVHLISSLLETLNKIVRSDVWSPSDTSYVCQMLMAAIEKSASKLTEAPTTIRLEVLVELMRVTDNPQTFNEALLLMANLARLTPDSVLHNIMPIFTFMGSNVFHRDDSYSFKVVQNTINNIVPVMVSSLKTKHLDGLDLYIGARDFLRIFTDASNHIPRHRRQNFFVHLAEVLGAQNFLPPVCMLLVDKVTNRASRQTPEEAQTTLTLPTSLMRHFERPQQLAVLTEVLKECLRLRTQLLTPETTEPAFLDYARDGEHSLSTSATLKRRIQALILFASTSLTPSEQNQVSEDGKGGTTTDIITYLLDLASLPAAHAPEGDLAPIVSAAQTAIERVMNVIAAREFLTATRAMLGSTDTRIKAGALGVISARVPRVTKTLREACQTIIVDLIGHIRDIIDHQSAGALVESALRALKALGSSCCAGEETALMSTLPHVLKVVRSRTSATAGMSVLPCYITALGPRIIPHFRTIAQECTSILREGLKGKTQLGDADEGALATLESLLSSLPAFYGAPELTEIAKLYVDYSTTSTVRNNPLAGLSKAISKKTSAEVLLPVLIDLWPSMDKAQTKEGVNGMIGYFVLLKRALHAAPRQDVLDTLRPMFKVFIEAFDVKMAFGFTEGEPHVISAFTELVVKLNENAFRPLFRRMQDWAFVGEMATNERKVTFCHIYTALLDYFKGLMNPYMSTLLRPLAEALQSFSTSPKTDATGSALWSGVIATLTKSLEADDGAFWREDKLATLLPHVVSQVPITVHLPSPSPNIDAPPEIQPLAPRQRLIACLLAVLTLLPNSSSDLLKRLNLDLLMHTRSEDARVRILALECSREMWKADGGKLIGFVGETATFIAECAEDENDVVVQGAHELKNAVEGVAGSISGL